MSGVAIPAPYVDPAAGRLLAAAPRPRRALFLDRDGVVNVDRAYVHRPEDTEWVPGIFALVAAAATAGFLPIVVTNQAGIARGLYGEDAFLGYTAWMHAEFTKRGSPLLATCHCPHHPTAGLGALRVACSCRKPKPGMLLRAIGDWDIVPGLSLMLGDKASDLEAAAMAGIGRAVFVEDCVLPSPGALFHAPGEGAGA